MKQPVERRLAAILAADVAGYSRLMGADEEGTLERLKAHRRELVDPKIKEHRGRIVKTTGDGLLAEFPSVVDAVRCAVEIQRGMIDRSAEILEDQRITFRIGVNLGDIIVDGDDIYGDGVNIAARLEALAEPGGICISRVVRDQIRDKLPYLFEDMGEQSVKNIARPVRAYAMSANAVASTPLVAMPRQPGPARRGTSLRRAVTAASVIAVVGIMIAAWWAWPRGNSSALSVQTPAAVSSQIPPAVANTPAPRLSFVVLPFANLSNDPDQEYFAEGITDDLTTDLSRISDSFVIARNTAFTYLGKSIDVRQIGRELGVRYVIEGSVRRGGDQVQVNVQLIDAETGAHLWADRFDTDRRNLAEAQSEITGRLARTLNVQLIEAVSRRIERERAADPDARDLVMRAWAVARRAPTAATGDEALKLAEQALEIDQGSVEAKIGTAAMLTNKLSNGWSSSVEQDQARAERLIQEALDRDPNNSIAHATMGNVRRVQNRLTEAQIELETAIALDRNNPVAFRSLGITLMLLGRPEAAIPYIEKSIRLSPHDPRIVYNYSTLGRCHLLLGHVDQAIDLLRKAHAANPQFWSDLLWLAGAAGLRGDSNEAKAALAEVIKLKPDMNSFAALRASFRGTPNPQYWALREKTLDVGLRRAGLPDE
ncbi:MAG TPA: adenylate/guanylate cyclase domain-containing protein [Stellaceae bacterium]|jgi:TolB-like protein/class 3 adenylate cyclase/Tfp pilus assembly protein PilF